MDDTTTNGFRFRARTYVGVLGHVQLLDRDDGAAAVLAQLGARVRTLDMWDDPANLVADEDEALGVRPRALIFEALDRPDLAVTALRAVRKQPHFDDVGAIVAVTVDQVVRVDPSSGFDSFVLCPYVPEELYARVRALEWRHSEFSTDERYKLGEIVVDRAGHEVSVNGCNVPLTAKEFALLVYFCEQRGRVLTRDHLLARIWGARYEGGERTVDIHVRRLRAKLGGSLPLDTLRRSGYKLRSRPGAQEEHEEEG